MSTELQELVNLPIKPLVLPTVVLQILEITSSDDDNAQAKLDSAISHDAGFSARMLTIANSAAFASSQPITTIKAAIMRLGLKGVRNLALTVGAGDLFKCKTQEDDMRAKMWWRASCDSAVCARWLAKEHRFSYSDEAYLSALLHCVGKMQILAAAPNSYSIVNGLIAEGLDVIEAECQVYGIDHIQLTINSVKSWGLPESLVNGVDYRREPEPNDPYAGLKAVTALGIAIADPTSPNGKPVIPEWTLQTLGEDPEKIDLLVARAEQVLDETVHAA